MDKKYDHKKYEDRMYKLWENSDAFKPTKSGKPFTIIMPPPNANDPLHIGHAMFATIEDILTRYHRMVGDSTLWLPGTDHAGIETQFVFEKKLKKQGKSRFDYDRATLYKMLWDYVQENSDVAISQLKKVGASADWSKYKFTLDDDIVEIVLETFKKLYEDGLIYRDEKLVNYCTRCGTAFSELEINHTKTTSPLFYIRYLFANKEGHVVVATTRPEPIFADTHLAVNPKDQKNKHLIGQELKNPLTGKVMQVIGDEFVDPEFGTGIVKLTPAHDHNDFEVAKKHDLPMVKAITTSGRITESFPDLAGLKVNMARQKAIEILQDKDLVEKIDNKYENTVGTCYRCSTPIEPLLMPQFFVKVKTLAKNVLSELDRKSVEIIGAGHDKILRHWLKTLKDWNISRQIVWGIKMPVWYNVKGKEGDIVVSFIGKNKKQEAGVLKKFLENGYSVAEINKGLQQISVPIFKGGEAQLEMIVSEKEPKQDGVWFPETDTFDTWFSSSQWPFATLKANSTNDFEKHYPTSVMETGYDILPFWVMRMLMMGLYKTNKVPFKKVYLHGLIRDEKGAKMSKSKGNTINPIDVIDKFGADALRMALVMSTSPGKDSNTGETKIRGMRNFTNKIWNAVRFITMQEETKNKKGDGEFLLRVDKISKDVSTLLNELKIGLAAETIYGEFWRWFCDECIEKTKSKEISTTALKKGLVVFLKLLHPFVPFVTEAVWQENKELFASQKLFDSPTLISAKWPYNND